LLGDIIRVSTVAKEKKPDGYNVKLWLGAKALRVGKGS